MNDAVERAEGRKFFWCLEFYHYIKGISWVDNLVDFDDRLSEHISCYMLYPRHVGPGECSSIDKGPLSTKDLSLLHLNFFGDIFC
jgi:hypothetical protein